MSDNSNDYPEATRPTIWPPSSDEVLRARLPWSPPCRCRCLVEVSCMLQRSRDLACTHQKDASSVWWQPVSCRPVPEYGPFSIRYRTSMDVSDGSSSRNRRSRNPLQRKPLPQAGRTGKGLRKSPRGLSSLVLPFPAILQECKVSGCRVRCACASCPTAHSVLSLMIRSTFSSFFSAYVQRPSRQTLLGATSPGWDLPGTR